MFRFLINVLRDVVSLAAKLVIEALKVLVASYSNFVIKV